MKVELQWMSRKNTIKLNTSHVYDELIVKHVEFVE